MATLRVLKPGMLTTVQDLGRWGYQAQGVPVAGPMDSASHRLANLLVGNPEDAATLEVTLIGPEFVLDEARDVAVCGAAFDVTVNQQAVSANVAFTVPAGGHVRVGARRRGARAYIAIAGGIAVPLTLGSRATHLISHMGGHQGRALVSGDVLPIGEAPHPQPGVSPSRWAPPLPDGTAHVRVLAGPQVDYFEADALDVLQSADYVISGRSDRMGFRLEGPQLRHARGADIISDATPLGVLQVPASGQPIVLMADRQTAGGYPKLATVITADLGLAGQLGPGDRIRFVVCTTAEAMAALIALERALMAAGGA